MALPGRGRPSRPIVVRGRYHLGADATLPAYETVAEYPPLIPTTPDARVMLPAYETVAEYPALDFVYDQRFTLPAYETVAEYPALSISVPILPGANITAPGQIEVNGFVMGSGTPYRWVEMEGWRDSPEVDSGNVPRATGHGSYPGRPHLQERIINWKLRIRAPRSEFASVVDDWELANPLPDDETEIPLVIWDLDESAPYLAYGQLRRRTPGAMDGRVRLGLAQAAVMQWVCSDPRRYNPSRRGVTVPVNVDTELNNGGNFNTRPLIRVEGPASGPSLANGALGVDGAIVAFTLDLDAGEVLEIDPANAIAHIDGVSVMNNMAASVPLPNFVLKAGLNPISYTTDSGGSNGADFLWYDARA